MRPALLFATLLGATIVSSGCYGMFGGVTVDYIDFVRAGDVTYVASYTSGGRELGEVDLGPERLRVKQTLARGGFGPGYQPVDGDAAFVPAGDPVYLVRGYSPNFRLAARHDGRLLLYEADTSPQAKRGADLLDIGGKVKSISLLSQKDGKTVLSRLTERSRIDDAVRLVLDGPVDQGPPGARVYGSNDVVRVSFELDDGTAMVRSYDRVNGVLWRGIQVAGIFQTTVSDLVLSAPTPSPVPGLVNLARTYDLAQAARVTVKSESPSGRIAGDASQVTTFAAALDENMPARRATRPGATSYTVVIFDFTDRIVSLAYDAASEMLTVVQPDDELAVRAPPRFVELLRPR
jgi:hypothetical protein